MYVIRKRDEGASSGISLYVHAFGKKQMEYRTTRKYAMKFQTRMDALSFIVEHKLDTETHSVETTTGVIRRGPINPVGVY